MATLNLQKNNVMVTGGAGFIGSHIVELLAPLCKRVIVYDDLSTGKKQNISTLPHRQNISLVQASITNPGALRRAMRGINYVFHQAALPLVRSEKYPATCLSVNAIGTLNVCQAAARQRVKKIIAASSSSVYGAGEYYPTDERHPLNSRTFYGASKIAGEKILHSCMSKYKLPYVALRYFNVYGPRQNSQTEYAGIVIRFIKKLLSGQQPLINGTGRETLDLIYVRDVARANLLAMRNPIHGQVLNVSSGSEISVQKLLRLLQQLLRINTPPRYRPASTGAMKRRFGTVRRIKRLLNFTPQMSLPDGLKLTIDWFNK